MVSSRERNRGSSLRCAQRLFAPVGSAFFAALAFACCIGPAWAVNVSVNTGNTLAVMPEYGMGIHTSVYDNSLWYIDNPPDLPGLKDDDNFDLLPGRLHDAGVNVLRYPGGGYADVYHFSIGKSQFDGGMTGSGLSPYWGVPGNFGYLAPKADFGNFIRLLDATNSKTVITVNTGSAIKYSSPNQLGVPMHNGQPQEAAAWVAYANADPAIYGTPQDIVLGTDAEGNNWRTAGYWAKLRASTPTEYGNWAGTAGVYDSHSAFLAINRDAPVGIAYWEIGNESFGTNYYGGKKYDPNDHSDPDFSDINKYRGYALNYAYPYDNTARDDQEPLSPASYGEQVNLFTDAMKKVDPNIKVGAVLATPRTTITDPDGDYSWSWADLNDNGIKDDGENYWNDEVLSHSTAALGRVADNVDFVIAHWYPSGNSSSIVTEPRITIPVMINGTTAAQDSGTNAGLRDSIAHWRTDGNAKGLEIFITETDGYGGATEASDGLFASDAYASFFENGVSNVDWLELHQDFDQSDSVQVGSFLAEFTNEPNFAYWGIQAVHLLAEPGDELVSSTTSEANVRIHASVQEDGTVAVMILNMNAVGATRTVNVSINGDTLLEDGVRYTFTGDAALTMASMTGLGNVFSTSIAGRMLQLFLIPPQPDLPGDFNHDGTVDTADYVWWRKSDQDPDHYQLWVEHYGQSQGGSGGGGTVPEPTALFAMLWGFGLICMRANWRRRRHRT